MDGIIVSATPAGRRSTPGAAVAGAAAAAAPASPAAPAAAAFFLSFFSSLAGAGGVTFDRRRGRHGRRRGGGRRRGVDGLRRRRLVRRRPRRRRRDVGLEALLGRRDVRRRRREALRRSTVHTRLRQQHVARRRRRGRAEGHEAGGARRLLVDRQRRRAVGAGMACEGIGVGGPTIGSGIDGVASDGGGVHIGGAADEPPVSTGAPQAKDLNSSEASPPLTLVPWNGAGVSGLAPPPFVSSVARSTRRASRRQRGPSRLSRISSKSSHASCAFCVRPLGLLDEQALDPVRDALVDLGADRLDRRDRLVDVAQQDRHRRVGVVERDVAREQLERHAADGVQVGPRTDVLRHRLLGRHVGRRADGRAGRGQERAGLHLGGRLGDAEVGDLHAPVGRDHEVLGLEVAVDDAVRLRVGEPGEQAFEHAADLRQRHPADVRAQRAALDVLHRDVRRAVVLEVVVHGDDVRVRQRPGHARLAQEALGERRVGRVERAQLLERDEPVEVGLAGEVHHRHAAATDLPEDLVAADRLHDLRHPCVPLLLTDLGGSVVVSPGNFDSDNHPQG